MTRAFTCSLILVTVHSCYSQPLTVQPSTIPGIEIAGPQSLEFAAAVPEILGSQVSDLPPVIGPWLPYAVVVRNNSPQPVAGMCIAFSANPGIFLDPGAGPCALWFASATLPLGTRSFQLEPGKAVLAFPHWILQQPGDLKPYRSLSEEKGLQSLLHYQRAKGLTVAVDNVVFASGQFVGPDTATQYQRFQSLVTAPRAVAKTLLEKKAGGTIADILAWLQTLAPQALVKDAPAYYGLQVGAEAREMLKVYDGKGEAALYSMAENILQAPLFPLHR